MKKSKNINPPPPPPFPGPPLRVIKDYRETEGSIKARQEYDRMMRDYRK